MHAFVCILRSASFRLIYFRRKKTGQQPIQSLVLLIFHLLHSKSVNVPRTSLVIGDQSRVRTAFSSRQDVSHLKRINKIYIEKFQKKYIA